MTLSSGLRRLARVVNELERANVRVHDAAVEPDADDEGRVRATVALSFPVGDEPDGTEISIDGVVQNSDTPTPDPDGEATDEATPNGDAPVANGAATITSSLERTADQGDGDIQCPEPGCEATFDSEPGMKVHRTKVHLSAGGESDAAPAYRDPERLADVYAAEDTFPEMRDALGADVSAQTVRRHMIRHGIHDPDPSADNEVPELGEGGDTAEAADDGPHGSETGVSPVDDLAVDELVADDIAVPADLELGDLRACVQAADTLYDVQQSFDLDRETARDLLAAFDLLELVHGRVATKHERDQLKAEIDRRIDATLTAEPN